jgi:hypothetical protein
MSDTGTCLIGRVGTMRRVRRLFPILMVALALPACGGSKQAAGPDFAGASSRTVARGTASFTLLIGAAVGNASVRSGETGTVSFSDRRAHFYKVLPGGGLPQEIILDGPFAYTNANVAAALKDSRVKPWTKLDTRRVPVSDRKTHPDELAHVRIVAYLADGVSGAKRVGVVTVKGQRRTHFRGLVDPKRLVARAPAAERTALRTAVRNDYLSTPFLADFWLDDAGRVRQVRVTYRTAGGGQIFIEGGFSNFGTKIDLTLPAANKIQDITP